MFRNGFSLHSDDRCKPSDDLFTLPLLVTSGHTVLQCLLGLLIWFVGTEQKHFSIKR